MYPFGYWATFLNLQVLFILLQVIASCVSMLFVWVVTYYHLGYIEILFLWLYHVWCLLLLKILYLYFFGGKNILIFLGNLRLKTCFTCWIICVDVKCLLSYYVYFFVCFCISCFLLSSGPYRDFLFVMVICLMFLAFKILLFFLGNLLFKTCFTCLMSFIFRL